MSRLRRSGQFGQRSGQAVYVIGTGRGPIKIGISESPYSRLATLQTSHPERLSVLYAKSWAGIYAREIETETHRALADHRLSGEWFDIPLQQAIDCIESIAAKLCLERVRHSKALVHTTDCVKCAEMRTRIAELEAQIAALTQEKAA